MACDLCEHCSGPITISERVICKGFSYHRKCQKCYFCEEPNLEGAETFKGLIFCNTCSNRIFHSLTPEYNPVKCIEKGSSNSRYDKKSSNREHKLKKIPTTISHNYTYEDYNKYSKSRPVPLPADTIELKYVRKRRTSPKDNPKQIIQNVVMETRATQGSIFNCCGSLKLTSRGRSSCSNRRSSQSSSKSTKHSKENNVSDMRIAKLGTSIEIASTALRKRSENIVMIKSMTCLKSPLQSADLSAGATQSWTNSTCASSRHKRCRQLNKDIQRIMKTYYDTFKKRILRRSSLVSELMAEEEPQSILKKINSLFREDITEHQRRGLKRLYSTINRENAPQKLGWLRVMRKMPDGQSCKHIAQSHSYRCMRAHVMSRAGPTKSELAVFRGKIKRLMVPTFRPMYGQIKN